MPQLIEHIDAIARRQRRAVLYLEFHRATPQRRYDYAHDAQRGAVLAWLDAHGLAWGPCGEFADVNVMSSYMGQIYLEVPYDESLAAYRLVRDYLEHPDGSMRHPTVRFCVMPLDYALRNAEHDTPGFWERAMAAGDDE
ncbi:hypothetical protein FHW58_001879 [Duganella sp. 1224]|uniref:hypothetical protein n=1 Tax=Duganella sp. 1224 TaxID=2587052 RepID=UPI0015CE50B3|nr:hypothetical protein [Duganella sp. 1224]NYE60727.1 hypothetical protein [Duganella sp. 1224]